MEALICPVCSEEKGGDELKTDFMGFMREIFQLGFSLVKMILW